MTESMGAVQTVPESGFCLLGSDAAEHGVQKMIENRPISQTGLNPSNVELFISTHGHCDHIGATGQSRTFQAVTLQCTLMTDTLSGLQSVYFRS